MRKSVSCGVSVLLSVIMVTAGVTGCSMPGAGTDTEWTGKYVPVGTYTIVEVKEGKGSEAGWGRLKSGAGWIALSYAKRV